jgi:hypothetical protein
LRYSGSSFLGLCWGVSNTSVENGFFFDFSPNEGLVSFRNILNKEYVTPPYQTVILGWPKPKHAAVKLEVVKRGKETKFFVNKVMVHSCELPTFYGPRMGVRVSNGEVQFEYFHVGVLQN